FCLWYVCFLGRRWYNGSIMRREHFMSASTRQQILATAERLFGEKGYHNVSMRAISSELGISVGNLTYHFPRKADLANALLEEELGIGQVGLADRKSTRLNSSHV